MRPDVLETAGLGRRYGRKWALRDCSARIPAGRVAALVGPNGAGKSTFLHMIVGLLRPTEGEIRVFGEPLGGDASALSKVAFVAQEKPLYESFTVADMFRLGHHLNPRWDGGLASRRAASLGLPPDAKVAGLSGGQQAQVALTLALAKRPDLMILDEPLSNLDPLARHEVMRSLMTAVAEDEITVLLSSHIVSDLEETCDWLILLKAGRVQLNGDIEELLSHHRLITGRADLAGDLPDHVVIVDQSRAGRSSTAFARTGADFPDTGPAWESRAASLEELVLAYLRQPETATTAAQLSRVVT
jgi:ABC-2 type transport system ATP-binding protein